MKRIIALAVLALGVFASTAGAAIIITQAPPGPGYKNLSPWIINSPGCSGQGSTYHLGDSQPLRLGFGWFANNQGGLKQFFQNSHGSVSITASAPGTDTFSDSWAISKTGKPFVTQKGITWTDGEAGAGTPPGGGTVTGVASWYRGQLSLGAGTYTLRVAMVLDDDVSDGWVTIPKDTSLDNGSGCTFTVVA